MDICDFTCRYTRLWIMTELDQRAKQDSALAESWSILKTDELASQEYYIGVVERELCQIMTSSARDDPVGTKEASRPRESIAGSQAAMVNVSEGSTALLNGGTDQAVGLEEQDRQLTANSQTAALPGDQSAEPQAVSHVSPTMVDCENDSTVVVAPDTPVTRPATLHGNTDIETPTIPRDTTRPYSGTAKRGNCRRGTSGRSRTDPALRRGIFCPPSSMQV